MYTLSRYRCIAKMFLKSFWNVARVVQQPTLSDMTQYELNFSLLVEQMLSKITDPAYRQMIVEVCCSAIYRFLYIVLETPHEAGSASEPIEDTLVAEGAVNKCHKKTTQMQISCAVWIF